MIEIFRVPPNLIYAAWGDIAPLLSEAVEMSDGRHNLVTTLNMLQSGHMTVLVALEKSRPVMACVIQVALYPAERWLQIPFCGGKNMKAWLDGLVDTVDQFAYNEQCVGVEIFGRGGWKRVLAPYGYVESHSIIQKRLIPLRKAA